MFNSAQAAKTSQGSPTNDTCHMHSHLSKVNATFRYADDNNLLVPENILIQMV